jgi:hypothetical protein
MVTQRQGNNVVDRTRFRLHRVAEMKLFEPQLLSEQITADGLQDGVVKSWPLWLQIRDGYRLGGHWLTG